MCMLLIAWRAHARYPLLIAANRDEYHQRASEAASWWPDAPDIYGGRDAVHGGSWLAVDRRGRFATVTNLRTGEEAPTDGGISRGLLVAGFLRQSAAAARWLETSPKCAPYNLVCGGVDDGVWFHSNLGPSAHALSPGVHGVGNGRLGSRWPKVEQSRRRMQDLLEGDAPVTHDALRELLADRTPAPDDALPETGLPLDVARLVSAPFVVSPAYGTRCSTIVRMDDDGTVDVHETRFDPNGTPAGVSECTYARTD